MSDKRGRRFVWRLLATAQIYSVVLTGDHRVHINEGRREVGLRFLLDLQEHMPARFVEMLKEHGTNDDPS